MKLERLALRAFPRHFRSSYGEEILADIRRTKEAGVSSSRVSRVATNVRVLANLCLSGLAERLVTSSVYSSPRRREMTMFDSMTRDLRLALRRMALSPGFSAVAIVTIALAVGANSTMFSVVSRILMTPLPYGQPDQLVRVAENDRLRGTQFEGVSVPDYFDWRERQNVFSELAAVASRDLTLVAEGAEPERVPAAFVSATLMTVLQRAPILGSWLEPGDDLPESARKVLIGEELWKRRFGGDPTILGETIDLDGESYSILGVMPKDLRFPSPQTEVWTGLREGPTTLSRGMHNLAVVARLAPDITVEMASGEMNRIMAELEVEYPDDNLGRGAVVVELSDLLVGPVRPALIALMGAVGLVLAIAGGNLVNLLMSRAAERRQEVSVRRALGAGRARLVRQFLVESVVLAGFGGVLGLMIAGGATSLLPSLAPVGIPRLNEVTIDWRVFVFTVVVTLLVGSVAGLLPALQTSRGPGARAFGGRYRQQSRLMLAVAQLALASVLVVGAGLLIKSMWRLHAVDPGYRPDGLLTGTISLPEGRYPSDFRSWPDAPAVLSFFDELREGVARVPGVDGVALALNNPAMPGWTTRVRPHGDQETPPGELDEERIRAVSPGYFSTIGTPLLAGRDLDERDRGHAPPAAVINEAFAAKYFGGEDPVGRQFGFWNRSWTVVGVVGNIKFGGLDRDNLPAMYPALAQLPFSQFTFVVRHQGDRASEIFQAIRAEVQNLDSDLAVFSEATLESLVSSSMAARRFAFVLLTSFAGLALVLAAIGVFGVVSYGVSERLTEFGVRLTFGANRADLVTLVLVQTARYSVIGLLFGVAGSMAANRYLASLLFGVGVSDPAVLVGVPVALVGVALAASVVPAYRASGVDPGLSLRSD